MPSGARVRLVRLYTRVFMCIYVNTYIFFTVVVVIIRPTQHILYCYIQFTNDIYIIVVPERPFSLFAFFLHEIERAAGRDGLL